MEPYKFDNPTSEAQNEQSSYAQYYLGFAKSYSDAANQLLENPSDNIFIPTLYLLVHSLELYFKTYLIYRGITEETLIDKFGHNLASCLKECNKQGLCKYLVISETQVQQINNVNRYYQQKELEYFYAKAKQFGSIEDFKYIVDHTSKAISNLITNDIYCALPESD